MTAYNATNPTPNPLAAEPVVKGAIAPSGSGGNTAPAAVTYRMRGFDTNGSVNDWVHWTANEIDSDASEYTGSAGPVTRISLVKEIGA